MRDKPESHSPPARGRVFVRHPGLLSYGFPGASPEIPGTLLKFLVLGLLLYRHPTCVPCAKRFLRTPPFPGELLSLISYVCERGLVGIRFRGVRQHFLITKFHCWTWETFVRNQ